MIVLTDETRAALAAGEYEDFPDIGNVFIKKVGHTTWRRVVTGLNGLGCPWVEETHGDQMAYPRTLSVADTREMLRAWKRVEPPGVEP